MCPLCFYTDKLNYTFTSWQALNKKKALSKEDQAKKQLITPMYSNVNDKVPGV